MTTPRKSPAELAATRLKIAHRRYQRSQVETQRLYASRVAAVRSARAAGLTLRETAAVMDCTIEAITKMLARAQ